MYYYNLPYEKYVEQFFKDKTVRFLEPMAAHEIDIYQYEASEDEIAELKYDGHRGVVHIGEANRAFSRVVSKKTGWYTENTEQVPHIKNLDAKGLFGTVLDGEFDYGTNSNKVQSVMGALPEKAIAYQEEHGYIPFKAFDILYYKGINVQRMPLWKRKIYLAMAVIELNSEHVLYAEMYMTEATNLKFTQLRARYIQHLPKDIIQDLVNFIYKHIHKVENFKELYEGLLEEEKEGVMLKNIYGIYEVNKRTKHYLKVKGSSTWDCVVMGYTDPVKEYDGKELPTWRYWDIDGELMELEGCKEAYDIADMQGVDAIPVKKPYYKGWCGGISFGVWKPVDYDELYDELVEECGGGVHADATLDQMVDEGVLRVDNDGNHLMLVHVGDCKGLTEKTMIDIKNNGDQFIGTVLEVKANGILDPKKGSLRHPRFKKWRKDKISEQCDWDSHIRNTVS